MAPRRGSGASPAHQRGDDLLLVRDDDAEDVDRHDRADEGADMDERAAAGEDVAVEPQAAATISTKTATASSGVFWPIGDLHSRS